MAELECQSLKQRSGCCSSARGTEQIAAEVASTSRGIHTDQHVIFWVKFQLLTSQLLSCSAAVSCGSAMGNMMQHFERELQYRCSSDSGKVMGSSTGCGSAVDEGQQAKHQQHRGPLQWISVILLLRSIVRAHSLLRGSVDFGQHQMYSSYKILWTGQDT